MIRQGERGPVKIGTAKDVARRLGTMQSGNHERLILLRMFEGGVAEERLLHKAFADHRITGEWFSWTQAMMGDVGLPEVGGPPVEEPPAAEGPEIEDAAAQIARAYDEGVSFGMKAATLIFRAATVGITPQDLADLKMSRLRGNQP